MGRLTQVAKIGMCCACGDQVSKSQTVEVRGFEYCRSCAEAQGIDFEEAQEIEVDEEEDEEEVEPEDEEDDW